MAKAKKATKKMKVIKNQQYRVRRLGKLVKGVFNNYEQARQYVRKVLRKEGGIQWKELGYSNPSFVDDIDNNFRIVKVA